MDLKFIDEAQAREAAEKLQMEERYKNLIAKAARGALSKKESPELLDLARALGISRDRIKADINAVAARCELQAKDATLAEDEQRIKSRFEQHQAEYDIAEKQRFEERNRQFIPLKQIEAEAKAVRTQRTKLADQPDRRMCVRPRRYGPRSVQRKRDDGSRLHRTWAGVHGDREERRLSQAGFAAAEGHSRPGTRPARPARGGCMKNSPKSMETNDLGSSPYVQPSAVRSGPNHKRMCTNDLRATRATAKSAAELAKAVGRHRGQVARWMSRPDWPFGRPPWVIEDVRRWMEKTLDPYRLSTERRERAERTSAAEAREIEKIFKAELGQSLDDVVAEIAGKVM